jgi:hypothetical protein
MQELTFPNIGEVFDLPAGDGSRTITMTVAGPCANIHNGQWYCLTHKKVFRNQFEKDSHIHRGKHNLAWLCLEHGLEMDPKWAEK